MGEVALEKIKRRVREMDPYQFEQLVAEIWQLYGYKTTVTKGSGDRGIDIEASKSVPYIQHDLIQVKRHSKDNTIGSDQIRNYSTLYNQEPHADIVVLITTGYFTSEAKRLADDLNVKTIDGDEIAGIIEEHSHNLKTLPKSTKKDQDRKSTNESTEDQIPDPVTVNKGDIVWTRSDQNKAEVIKVRESSDDYIVIVHKDEIKTKRTVKKHEIAKNEHEVR